MIEASINPTSMSKPKSQHWVPRFYLRYFATPETKETSEPRAWIFSKEEGPPALTSIRKVGAAEGPGRQPAMEHGTEAHRPGRDTG